MLADEPERDPRGDERTIDDDNMATGEAGNLQPSRPDQKRRGLNGYLASKLSAATATATASVQELEQEELELAALRELGLPSSFGGTTAPSSHHPSQTQGAAWMPDQTIPSSSTAHPAIDHTHTQNQWHQGIDPETGYFYYYCEALGQTQWEPPSEGYIQIPPSTKAWWLPPGTGEEQDTGEYKEQQQRQPAAMEGVIRDGAAAEKSPYAVAVESYKEYHGWPEASEKQLEVEEEEENLGPKYRKNEENESKTKEEILANLDAHLEQVGQQRQHQQKELLQETRKEKVVEKHKPRIETTGLLPHIPHPDPGQHLRFGSSSSSDNSKDINSDDEHEEMQMTTLEDEEHQAGGKTAIIPAAKAAGKKRRGRRGGRQRKVYAVDCTTDRQGQIVVPPRLHKYWLQRYSFFSKYDQGILIDEEGWYSVTPEVIAWHHAKRLVASVGSRKCLAVDAFGGMGGNSIQLALAGCHVIVIELDPHKASILRHNTQIYGVDHLVEVICGDFLQVAPRIRADVAVLSPPWGGPEYAQKEKFDVENMGGHPELGLSRLLELSFDAMRCTSALVWLPRSSSLDQIEKAVAAVGRQREDSSVSIRCEVEIAALNGVTKAMTVYLGTAAKFRGPKQ